MGRFLNREEILLPKTSMFFLSSMSQHRIFLRTRALSVNRCFIVGLKDNVSFTLSSSFVAFDGASIGLPDNEKDVSCDPVHVLVPVPAPQSMRLVLHLQKNVMSY